MQVGETINVAYQQLWRNEPEITVPMPRSDFEPRLKAGDDVYLQPFSTDAAAEQGTSAAEREGDGRNRRQ